MLGIIKEKQYPFRHGKYEIPTEKERKFRRPDYLVIFQYPEWRDIFHPGENDWHGESEKGNRQNRLFRSI
jgi:hypothetical protein